MSSPVGERGQVLILLTMVMTVVFLIGAIAIDLGLWLSERRGAQTAADFAALGGVQELVDDEGDADAAYDAAVMLATRNYVDPARIDSSITSSCSTGNSCIDVGSSGCRDDSDNMPWVEARIRRPAKPLFTSIFGLDSADIGAVARACVGSIHTVQNLSPFGIQTGFNNSVGPPETDDECINEDDDDGDGEVNDGCPLSTCLEPDPADPTRTMPVYGAVCILKTSAGDSVSGQRGQLTIGTTDCSQTSSSTLRHDFHYGTTAACTVGQEVNTGTGNIIGLLQGLNDRLEEEGLCDQLFGQGNPGHDDFNELFSIVGGDPGEPVVPSADNIFSSNNCYITSTHDDHVHTYIPRAVDLVLIDELEGGSQTATITGFAAFYVIGCVDGSQSIQTKEQIEMDLNQVGSYLNRCEQPTGQDDILGIFVKSLKPPDNVGDPDENLPTAIVLVK